MAANLTAVFELVDRISDKLDAIANRGDSMINNWENAGEAIDQSFDRAVTVADQATAAIDGYNQAMSEATSQTEDFGEQGIRSAEALTRQTDILERCDEAAQELLKAIEKASKSQKDCSAAMEKANKISEKIANSDKVSAKAKEELEKATEEAAQAFAELENAQTEAQSAMNEYDAILSSEATNLDEIEEASNRAAQAADRLRNAQNNATDAANDLSDATEDAANEAEEAGKKGKSAAEELESTLVSVGIVAVVKEITQALLDASAAAAKTETAFAKLQTIAGADAMGMLSEQIIELSADTGIAQDVLSNVAYNAISAGSAVEEAVGTAEAATKLASAGFTDTTSALSVLSTAMNSYGDTAGTVMDISDSLVTVQNLGVTTVAELAANMGKSISTAAAYNVSLGNLESSYVSVTKAGINTAEATTYISGMLSELGKEGSTVATILQEQTGQSFGQLMSSGYSLADVLGIIYDAAGNDAEAMMNLWGSQTAGVASAAIINQGLEEFNENLIAIENSAGATESAYSVMANTTEHSQEKMANSAENLQIVIGNVLNPTLKKLYDFGTGAFQWAADFAEEHPVVVKAVTALTVGLGVLVVGVVAVTAATKVLNTVMSANPIFLAISGVVALTIGIASLVAMMSDAEDETAGMTAVTRQQYYELQDLNAEYERACETYGENSEEALRLKYQVDDLSEAFENNRQTLEEFQTEVDELCTSVDNLWNEFDKNISTINANETGALALIQKYEDLTEKTELTAGEQKQLEAVTRSLAEQFPDLTAQIDAATISTEAYIEAMRKTSKAEADKQRQEEAQAAYVEALKRQVELEEEIAKAEENLRLETEAFNNTEWAWWSDQAFYQATGGWLGGWTNDIDEYQAALDELKAAQEENNAQVAELEKNFEALAEKEKEVAERQLTDAEAVSIAYGNVREKIEDLCAAYDDAYQAALESFEGQFGLFDEASTKSEDYMNATVENAQKALDSQLAYWDSYYENIETLKSISAGQLGVTQESYEALMSYVQNGSEQAAGLASSMAEAIKNGDTEAVKNLAETIGDISAKQEEIAASTADWQTNFETEMKILERDMKQTVRDLDLSDEAAASATSTIEEYADKIREGKTKAVEAAKEVAEAVSAALLSAETGTATPTVSDNLTVDDSGNLVPVPAHANGTTYAEDVFIAGENGPELIVGQQGSTVFPTSETDKIIDTVSAFDNQQTVDNAPMYDYNFDYSREINQNSGDTVDESVFNYDYSTQIDQSIGDTYEQQTVEARASNRTDSVFVPVRDNKGVIEDSGTVGEANTRKILLEIAGKGNIELTGGQPDKESLLSFLYEYLKPVLSEIISQEIFEEGDLSYEY